MDSEKNAATAEKGEKESIPRLFGRNVRKFRKARGLTQEQLSEKLEITQKHLSIVETGTQFASASLIGRISEALEVSPGDLFGGSSDEIKKEIAKSQDILLTVLMNEMNRQRAILSSEIEKLRNELNRALNLKNGAGQDFDPFNPFGI